MNDDDHMCAEELEVIGQVSAVALLLQLLPVGDALEALELEEVRRRRLDPGGSPRPLNEIVADVEIVRVLNEARTQLIAIAAARAAGRIRPAPAPAHG